LNNGQIAIIDLGGQYCHLIARRLRDLGVDSQIFPPAAPLETLSRYAGVILSGGPQSVYEAAALTTDPGILELDSPVLGICYGHQLLAKLLGGEVSRQDGEFGFSRLQVHRAHTLFQDTPASQQVWMSHSDAVHSLPVGTVTLASTGRCAHAAFAHLSKKVFGLQFHPEVVHTEYGANILQNFVRSLCGISQRTGPAHAVEALCERIRQAANGRSVFFLVSGGVDSTVAFVLAGIALSKQRVLGLYVDTGLMRQGETGELRSNLARHGLEDRVQVWDASNIFLQALARTIDPEEKRQIIGRLFVEVQSQALRKLGVEPDHWLLGQGTIYPDTIESGGDSGRAALIKTHHNRCEEIRELIRQGKVIEPLAEFYKDEVRALGRELGLSAQLTGRWPFPGPGLAIRCICAGREEAGAPLSPVMAAILKGSGFDGVLLPLRSVGVQGDARTYRKLVALAPASGAAPLTPPEVRGSLMGQRGPIDYLLLRKLSSALCNENTAVNRVVLLLALKGNHQPGAGQGSALTNARVVPATITSERLDLLRKADFIVRSEMELANLASQVWQFPVVLAPITFHNRESVILRPVNSVDGMTASFASLPEELLRAVSRKILELPGAGAIFLDVTNKPPATIEWE